MNVYKDGFMKKIIFKGCGTAIATPFNKEGINFSEFFKLLENQINKFKKKYTN